MKEIYTEIEIQASDDKVWRILTDFKSYPLWNPFIRKADGNIKLGDKLQIILQPPGSTKMSFSPTVIKLEDKRELRWLGHLLIPGLFDGEHIFVIKQMKSNKVKFIQREIFKGLLVPLFAGKLYLGTKNGFMEMNIALKKLAEQT
jgi:hypothetical protein